MQDSNICIIVKLLAIEEDDEGEGNYSKGHTTLHCRDRRINTFSVSFKRFEVSKKHSIF